MDDGKFTVEMLIVKSQAEKDEYLRMPLEQRKGKARERALQIGKTYLFPVIVEDYQPDTGLVKFSADAVLVDPHGKQTSLPVRSRYELQNARIERIKFVVLEPIINLSFDANDPPGRYKMRVSVADKALGGTRTIEEAFDVVH